MTMKKKLISIIGLFLLCAMLFCGCDVPVDLDMDETDATAKETEKQTEEQTEKPTEKATEDKKPSKEPENNEPEKVDSINGKSAADIVEKFFEDYTGASKFDMEVFTANVIDGEVYEDHIALKTDGTDLYMLIEEGELKLKFWSIDGTLYMDDGEQKLKVQADNIEDYVGVDFAELLTSTVPSDLHRIYKDKLRNAEITFNGISYSFTVTFSYEEALEMAEDDEIEEEVCGFSETYVVGTDGRVKAILSDYENGSCSSVEFNSYGKPVTVDPPKNADDFVETDIGGGEDDWGDYDDEVDPEAYALYYDLCVLLEYADSYDVLISQDEESLANYTVTGDNKYVMGLGYSRFEAWIVDDRAYALSGGSFSVINEAVTDGFYEYYFESIEEYLTYAYEWNDIEWMSYIYSYEDDLGNTIIEFEVSRGGNFFDKYYTYTIGNEGRTIEVDIWYFSGDEFMGSMYYRFDCINDPDLTIVAPL